MLSDRLRYGLAEQVAAAPAILIAVAILAGCAFIGQQDATVEQQFYEADKYCTVSIAAAASTVRALDIELTQEVKDGLRMAMRSLRATRGEVRAWVSTC